MLINEVELRQIVVEVLSDCWDEKVEGDVDERSERKISRKYLTRDATAMRKEIEKHAHKKDDDPSAYTSHPKGDWKADYTKGGKRYKTRPSKYTQAFKSRFGEGEEMGPEVEEDLELREMVEQVLDEEMLSEAGDRITKALKNKAEKANAPLGALRTVYRKGLAAWKTGHRPGVSQHQWAMGRVNSFLTGGKARKVDSAQWKQVLKHRKKK